jgi:5'-3' exonuclease
LFLVPFVLTPGYALKILSDVSPRIHFSNNNQDEHIIISSDSDFYQLISDNVSMYNGISNTLINTKRFYDDVGKEIVDKKTLSELIIICSSWLLFEKCMRGDTSDNIFSAYPGVRTKGTRNKVGLKEAFEDRHKQGYSWNNLMLQRWEDHDGTEHRVKDRYEQNKALIDLTAQPNWVKEKLDQAISTQVQQDRRPQISLIEYQFVVVFLVVLVLILLDLTFL